MDARRKVLGLSLGIAIALTACGGDSQSEGAASIPAAEVVEEDAQEATTTIAEQESSSTTTTEAEPAETTTTTELAQQGCDAGEGLASDWGTDEITELLERSLGPTDDIAAVLSCFAEFPEVSTLPDTDIFGIQVVLQPDQRGGLQVSQTATFTTSTSDADALAAYEAEYLALGYGPSVLQEISSFTNIQVGPYSVSATEPSQFIQIQYNSAIDPELKDFSWMLEGVAAETSNDPNATIRSGGIGLNAAEDAPRISVTFN